MCKFYCYINIKHGFRYKEEQNLGGHAEEYINGYRLLSPGKGSPQIQIQFLEQRADCPKVSSDLYTCTVMHAHACASNIHKIINNLSMNLDALLVQYHVCLIIKRVNIILRWGKREARVLCLAWGKQRTSSVVDN